MYRYPIYVSTYFPAQAQYIEIMNLEFCATPFICGKFRTKFTKHISEGLIWTYNLKHVLKVYNLLDYDATALTGANKFHIVRTSSLHHQ